MCSRCVPMFTVSMWLIICRLSCCQRPRKRHVTGFGHLITQTSLFRAGNFSHPYPISVLSPLLNRYSPISQSMYNRDQPGSSSSTTSPNGKQRASIMTEQGSLPGLLVNTPLEESVWPPARESDRWTASDFWRKSRERAKTDRNSWDYGKQGLYSGGFSSDVV